MELLKTLVKNLLMFFLMRS